MALFDCLPQEIINNIFKIVPINAFSKCNEAEIKFGKNDFAPKFSFIKAMCIGKLKGADSLEIALKQVQIYYPKDPVSKQAQDILEVLYNLKHPSETTVAVNKADTFSLDLNSPHLIIYLIGNSGSRIYCTFFL
jgi:hypothetical protein